MAVDWENRIDFDRLRTERLARAKALLAKSEMGALLCFDMNNVRYLTATHIGTWAQDKMSRFSLLPQNDEPILWDFGSAARHHQLHCPWLGERSRAVVLRMVRPGAPWSTPTRAAGNIWTRRFRWFAPGARPEKSLRCGQRRRRLASRMKKWRLRCNTTTESVWR